MELIKKNIDKRLNANLKSFEPIFSCKSSKIRFARKYRPKMTKSPSDCKTLIQIYLGSLLVPIADGVVYLKPMTNRISG